MEIIQILSFNSFIINNLENSIPIINSKCGAFHVKLTLDM